MRHQKTIALVMSSLVLLICVNAFAQKTKTSKERTYFMFVQSADSGSVAPIEGKSGAFRLSLTGVAPTTVYFSDRPARVSGQAPMDKFLKGLGFSASNPPNAAIDAVSTDGESRVVVVTLESPHYDATAATLTYDVHLLPGEKLPKGLAHLKKRLGDLPPSFKNVALFIDDCPDSGRVCYTKKSAKTVFNAQVQCSPDQLCGTARVGTCWGWFPTGCFYCHAPESDCNAAFFNCCNAATAAGCTPGCTSTSREFAQ